MTQHCMWPNRRHLVLTALVALCACRPGDVLDVPPPDGVVAKTAIEGQTGAENLLADGQYQLAVSVAGGLLEWTDLLTDEFTWSGYTDYAPEVNLNFGANIDARQTRGINGFQESADPYLEQVLNARSDLVIAQAMLEQYEPANGRYKVSEAYALVGYTELFLGESFCAGVPLSQAAVNGGIIYGPPLTTDSLLAIAEAHFDSAVAYAGTNDTAMALSGIGLGRARLDRGEYAQAGNAVANVPTNFVYNMNLQQTYNSDGYNVNVYAQEFPADYGCGYFNVSDREGTNGLDFVSAQDPRLVLDSTIQSTCDGGMWYYPVKFGSTPPANVAMATGVEARLISAEAALNANDVNTWANDLNALRADAADTHITFPSAVLTIPADSTTGATSTAQVDLMFRERAFWLFGTGTRLGDLRRLIRNYSRNPETVFPTGTYVNGENPNLATPLPTYGADVSLTLPTKNSGYTTTNPNYKGCLSSPATA